LIGGRAGLYNQKAKVFADIMVVIVIASEAIVENDLREAHVEVLRRNMPFSSLNNQVPVASH